MVETLTPPAGTVVKIKWGYWLSGTVWAGASSYTEFVSKLVNFFKTLLSPKYCFMVLISLCSLEHTYNTSYQSQELAADFINF